jgi:hypothetical protein
MRSGRAAVAFAGLFGHVYGGSAALRLCTVRALEVTNGSNGWHPHIHELLFLPVGADLVECERRLRLLWSASLIAAGQSSNEHGLDFSNSGKDIADYIAKWGKDPRWSAAAELTKSNTKISKENRSPAALLADYTYSDDKRAGRLWLEYAEHFHGKRQLVWSPGARGFLGLDAERSDEDIAADVSAYGVRLLRLSVAQWAGIIANDARSEVLTLAGGGLVGPVWDFLIALGLADGPAPAPVVVGLEHDLKSLDYSPSGIPRYDGKLPSERLRLGLVARSAPVRVMARRVPRNPDGSFI